MAYTEITNRDSPNFTRGRGGKKINKIVIHWWGSPSNNPSAEGVVNWLCNPASQVSAHAVATGTGRRVWWLVNDSDTAWHAGNFDANQTSIGIECDPRCRNEDYDVVAELIANIWKVYGKLPLEPHKKFTSTACPGNYDLSRLRSLAEQKLNPAPSKPVWIKMDNPRVMVAAKDLYAINLVSGQNSGATIKKGTDIELETKTTWGGKTYLRTKYSTSRNLDVGIDLVNLTEKTTTKQETIVKSIPFTSRTIEDPKSPRGEKKVAQKGVNGKITTVIETTYTSGVETSRKTISEKTDKPVEEIVAVGTYVDPSNPLDPETGETAISWLERVFKWIKEVLSGFTYK